MSDREKMIEVIRGWSSGALSPIYAGTLADRLIEAGFGITFERVGVYRWSGGFRSDDLAVIENGEVLYKRVSQ